MKTFLGQEIIQPTAQEVNVTILNRQNSQPLENVEIQIIFDGPPVSKMTDRNGYVEVQIPSRKTAQITLRKEGYKTTREFINLEAEPNTTRIIYLEQAKTKN